MAERHGLGRTQGRVRRVLAGAAAAGLAVGLLVGCGATDVGGGGSSASSSVVVSPSASGTPSLSPDELYAEAERVFRSFFEEFVVLESAGGADELPPIMSEYVMGEAYDSLSRVFRESKARGIHFGPGEVTRLTAVAPATSDLEGAVAAVQSCNDSTGNTVYDANGTVIGSGGVELRTSAFKWDGSKLKIFKNHVEAVSQCPLV